MNIRISVYYFSFLHIVQDFYTVMMYNFIHYIKIAIKTPNLLLKKITILAHQSMPSSEMTRGGHKEKISCPICQVVVVRRVFRRHYETMHCVQNPVSCQFCQKTFKHRYSLDCHQRQSHPEEKKKKLKQILESQQKNDLWNKILKVKLSVLRGHKKCIEKGQVNASFDTLLTSNIASTVSSIFFFSSLEFRTRDNSEIFCDLDKYSLRFNSK